MPVTLREVAAAAGVSRPTTNLIVLGKGERFATETRIRVLDAARVLNYRPNLSARGLIKQRSHLIAGVVSQEYASTYPDFSHAFQQGVLARGYLPLTIMTLDTESQRQMLTKMAEARVDALVVNRAWADDDGAVTRQLEVFRATGTPVVELFMNYVQGAPSVRIDWEEAGRLALLTLQGLGLRQPVMWTPLLPQTGGRLETLEETHDQYRGWAKAARTIGAPARVEVHPALPLRSQEGPRRDSPLYGAAGALMGRSDRPDGVMACSSSAAAHLSLFLRDHPRYRPPGFTIAHWHDPVAQVQPEERRVVLRLQTERLAELAVKAAFDGLSGMAIESATLGPTLTIIEAPPVQ